MTQQRCNVGLGNAGIIQRCSKILSKRMKAYAVSHHSAAPTINCEALR